MYGFSIGMLEPSPRMPALQGKTLPSFQEASACQCWLAISWMPRWDKQKRSASCGTSDVTLKVTQGQHMQRHDVLGGRDAFACA